MNRLTPHPFRLYASRGTCRGKKVSRLGLPRVVGRAQHDRKGWASSELNVEAAQRFASATVTGSRAKVSL